MVLFVNFGMIQLAYIVISIFSVVIGVYAIFLLQNMRNKFNVEFLNSLFYFQILSFIFGIYGILGSLLIRQILPKFDMSHTAIESISHFIPLIGLPFLIAAWFMQIKFSAEVCKKKISKLITFGFFLMAMGSILLFGYYVFKISGIEKLIIQEVRKNIFLGFGMMSLVFEGYIVIFLLINSIVEQKKDNRIFLSKLFLIIGGVSIIKACVLYFSQSYVLLGLYFILIYFSSTLPVILLLRKNTAKFSKPVFNDVHIKESLFNRFYITPREQDIILEICKGKTNKEISESLFITVQTVKDHTHNIFQKTEVKNRVQLAQLFSGN